MDKNGTGQPEIKAKARLRQINLKSLLESAEGAVGRTHPYFLLNFYLVRVTVVATDLNISIVSEMGFRDGEQVEMGGIICVPARKFLDLIKALPDAFIDLAALEGNRLQVECGDYTGIIPCVDHLDHFPVISLPDGPPDFGCAGDLIPGLHAACAHAMDKRGKSAMLTGLHLCAEGDVLIAAATDGSRLSMAGKRELDYTGEVFAKGITIPARALAELKKITAGTTEVYLRENALTFVQRGITLMVRLLDGDYPQYRRAIPTAHPHCCVVNAKEFAAIVERVNVLSDADSVLLDIKPGEHGETGDILISAENEAGRSMDLVPAEIEGAPLQIRVTPSYMVEALSSLAVTSEDVIIKYLDAESALVLLPCDHSGWDERVEVFMPRKG